MNEDYKLFINYCKEGKLLDLKQLLEDVPTIDISAYNDNAFQFACYHGHLKVVQWLYHLRENPKINISMFNELPFRMACENSHLDVAQWLLSVKPTIDISACDEYAFVMVCSNGNLKVAQWLLSVKPTIDISADYEYAFRIACSNDKMEMAQWLLSVKPTIDISAENEYAFRAACSNGYLEVAKWLLFVKPNINIFIKNDFAFKNCDLQVAKWLQSLYPEKYDLVIINDKIVNRNIKRSIAYTNNIVTLCCENKEDNVCPICYDAQVEVQTNCRHNFCIKCITDYYNNYNSNDNCKCPYCRQILTSFNKLVINYK